MKALVLLSGGVDSSTCLGAAVDKYGSDNVIALSVFYGQKHKKELEAAENVAKHYGVPLKTLDLALIFADSDCSLLTGSSQEIPQLRRAAEKYGRRSRFNLCTLQKRSFLVLCRKHRALK